jgi:hypothetical protein
MAMDWPALAFDRDIDRDRKKIIDRDIETKYYGIRTSLYVMRMRMFTLTLYYIINRSRSIARLDQRIPARRGRPCRYVQAMIMIMISSSVRIRVHIVI